MQGKRTTGRQRTRAGQSTTGRVTALLATPLLVLASGTALAAPFHVAAVKGTYGFVGWHQDTAAASAGVQPAAPAPGTALPAATGYTALSGIVTFDGAGGLIRSYAQNTDGTVKTVSDRGTYTCTVQGVCALNVSAKTFQLQFNPAADAFVDVSVTAGVPPRFQVGTKLSATPVTTASVLGTAAFCNYGVALGISPGTAPQVGLPLPPPLGFAGTRGLIAFDGAGNGSIAGTQDTDGSDLAFAGVPLTYALTNGTNANGQVAYTVGGVAALQGWIGGNGMGVSASTLNGLSPRISIAVPHGSGPYSAGTLSGRYSLAVRTRNSAGSGGVMPTPGTALPSPGGFVTGLFALQADGKGGAGATGTVNQDGVLQPQSHVLTYTVSATGELQMVSDGSGKFDGYLSSDGNAFVLSEIGSNPANPDPTLLVGLRAPAIATGQVDLNADGQSDLLWHNADGTAAAWLMNGAAASATAAFGPYAGWTLASGDSDFNADGRSDLVWKNVSGAVSLWLMNGLTATATPTFGPYAGWSLLSANSDFNGDGKSDLLWVNTNGQVAVWLMDGATLLSQTTFGPYPGWSLVSGNNDFDGDGATDLLWRNTDGTAALWLMHGATPASTTSFGPYAGWTVVSGNADYDGDGKTDLLWQNSNGQVAVWLMNGLTQTASAAFGPYPGWSVLPGNRDFNGDGKSDLLWQNSNGAVSAWLMNGLVPTAQPSFGPFAGWSVLAATGDYNGDGNTDLLWTNVDGTASTWLMNGVTPATVAAFGPYAGWSVLPGHSLP